MPPLDAMMLHYAQADIAALAHLPKTYAPTIPPWAGQVTTLPARCTGALSGDLCDGWHVTVAAYGPTSVLGTDAFSYLWRRFGPPWWGSDDYKDLVRYLLQTSHPEVFLSFRLSASELLLCVGYLVTKDLRDAWHAPVRRDERHPEVCAAIHEALIECLRPVFVYDTAINILGQVPTAQLDDRETCARSVYAGYGMPREALDALREDAYVVCTSMDEKEI